jgi:hypothetical protein
METKQWALTLSAKQQTIHKVDDRKLSSSSSSSLSKIKLTTDKILEVEIKHEVSCTLPHLS